MSTETQPTTVLTTKEAANRLGISKPKVLGLLQSGDLEGFKTGPRGSWRIKTESIDIFVEKYSNQNNTPAENKQAG